MNLTMTKNKHRNHEHITIRAADAPIGIIIHSGSDVPDIIEDSNFNYYIYAESEDGIYRPTILTDPVFDYRLFNECVYAILLPGDVLEAVKMKHIPTVVTINGKIIDKNAVVTSYIERCQDRGGIDHVLLDRMIDIVTYTERERRR